MNTLKRGSLSKIYIVVLILVIGYVLYNIGGSLITSDYKYKDFLNDMKNKNVSEITIKQNKEIPTGKIIVKLKNDETKSIYVSDVNKVSDDIEEINNNVGTDIRPYLEDVSRDSIFLTTVLPMILLGVVVLIVFMMMNANANGGGGKMANFGKSRAKMVIDIKNMDFSKVAGLEEEKEELEEIVDFLKNPKKYIDLGARIPKGVLLEGPPGTGKTLLAKATAGEAKVPFFTISGSDFVEMFVGVGASRVRDLFAEAKKNAPCIIFIDEIDAVARRRGTGMGGGHDEREQTLNQMLVEMDGFGVNEGIIVMAATNRVDILDPAILRPGRFDRKVMVGRPDVKGRKEILEVHAKNKPIGDDVDLQQIAQITSGFTGADLENLLNEASILAAKEGKAFLTQEEINKAMIKVGIGKEKRSKIISEKEKQVVSPTLFWLLSLLGSYLLFFYGWLRNDFAIILGQLISYYIYIWNLNMKNSWQKIPVLIRYILLITPIVAIGYMLAEVKGFINQFFYNENIPFGLLLWGSLGQIIFTLRFVYQWVYSRRHHDSILPMGFWLISLSGSLIIVSYALVRHDPVLILGQSTGLVVYCRDIWILYKNKKQNPDRIEA